MTRKTSTRKTTVSQSSAPQHPKAERMTLHTLEGALAAAVRTFSPDDALVRFIGEPFCHLTDLVAWIAALPADQRAERRYVVSVGDITDLSTGAVASHFVTVEMAPPHIAVLPDGDTRIRRDTLTFLLAVQSLGFLSADPGLDKLRRVRPVALNEDGLEFEAA